MTTDKDIRWEQRFSNFQKALNKLSEAIEFINKDLDENKADVNKENAEEILDEIIKEGLIQRFEYTHELAWNVMKDFLSDMGDIQIYGSKDATREAFKAGLIQNGDVWMEMIKSRNKTSHTYNEETADEPSHDKNFDTHADDYNSQHGKTCSQGIVGELHLTELIKL